MSVKVAPVQCDVRRVQHANHSTENNPIRDAVFFFFFHSILINPIRVASVNDPNRVESGRLSIYLKSTRPYTHDCDRDIKFMFMRYCRRTRVLRIRAFLSATERDLHDENIITTRYVLRLRRTVGVITIYDFRRAPCKT